MSDATTHLLLPYILAAQAQKHVTHNEALRILDGLVQLSVLDRDLTAPPGSPADGDRYIVGSGAMGDWAGWDQNVALWTDGAWLRLPPRTGWRAWVEDERLLLVYDGAAWIGTTPAALQNLALLGLGTTADASNPFSAKLNAALWTAKTVAEGGTGDLFYTMNKEAAGDDLGLTLQTGFVTKALVGLFGSDRFRLAVSADGSTFFDGLSVDNTTGSVDQPRLPRFKAYTNYDNYVGVGTWTKIGLNNTDYNDQGAFDAANNYFMAPVDGTYLFGATLLYKVNASTTARMRGRLVLNGTTEIRGSFGESSATQRALRVAVFIDKHPAQAVSSRTALAVAQLHQSALPGKDLHRKLPAVFARHDPLDGLQKVRADAAVVFELLAAIVDADPGTGADMLVIGPFISILKPTPAADVIDQNGLEIRLAGSDLCHQVLQRLATVQPQPGPTGVLEDAQDLQAPGSGVIPNDVELVLGGVLLVIGRHPDIGDGRHIRFRWRVALIRMGRPSTGHLAYSSFFQANPSLPSESTAELFASM